MSLSGQLSMMAAAVNGWYSTPQIDPKRSLSKQPLSTPKKTLAVAQGALAICGANKCTALGTWALLAARTCLDQADDHALHNVQLAGSNNRALTRGFLLALGSEFPWAAAALTAILAVTTPDRLASPETRDWLKRQVTHLTGLNA